MDKYEQLLTENIENAHDKYVDSFGEDKLMAGKESAYYDALAIYRLLKAKGEI